MAHFAEIDNNNIVLRVIVVHNTELLDENGNENESKGIQFCKDHYGQDTGWVQTSYNNNFRKNYAGAGYLYDEVRNAFIGPKPFNSWILNEETCRWDAPVPIPDDVNTYFWDEETISWVRWPTEENPPLV